MVSDKSLISTYALALACFSVVCSITLSECCLLAETTSSVQSGKALSRNIVVEKSSLDSEKCRVMLASTEVSANQISKSLTPNETRGSSRSDGNKSRLEWRFSFDRDGKPTKMVDPAERMILYEYTQNQSGDIHGVTKKLPDGKTIGWDYDRLGRLKACVDPNGKMVVNHDSYGRLSSVQRDGMPRIAYSHDALGRVSAIHVGEKHSLYYEYDFMGRLSSLKTPVGQVDYSYWPSKGRVIRKLPNGVASRFEYLPDGKLQKIVHTDKDNRVLASFDYSYRPDGLIASTKEWTRTASGPSEMNVQYQYDKAGRLIEAKSSPGKVLRMSYDRFGNRISVDSKEKLINATYDWDGKILTNGTDRFGYDTVGNLTTWITQDGHESKYDYDVENHLVRFTRGDNSVSYKYDCDGKVIERTHGTQTNRFLLLPFSDIWQPLVTLGKDEIERLYIWDSRPIGSLTRIGTEFYLEDALGSVRLVVDHDGNVTRVLSYDPFGVPSGSTFPSDLAPGFAGLFLDPSVGIYVAGVRRYVPELCRFMERDPSHSVSYGSQKNLSAYTYCANDPVNFVDRNGRRPTAQALDAYSDSLVTHGKRVSSTADLTSQGMRPKFEDKSVKRDEPAVDKRIKPAMTSDADSQEAKLLKILVQGLRLTDVLDYCSSKNATRFCDIDIEKLRQTLLDQKRRKRISHRLAPYWADSYEPLWWVYEPYVYYWRTYPSSSSYNIGRYYSSSSTYYRSISRSYSYAHQHGAAHHHAGNVGGVWLSGASKALEGLGKLKGVELDEANGRIVLLGDDKKTSADLSALRLDDVVAIFKSVYDHGKGPWVSIEDDPKNRKGSHKPQYGPEMEGTFAGWVLYEADRVMKNYGVGADNITKQIIRSGIRDYRQLIDQRFLEGWSGLGSENGRQIVSSTRFWITPEEVVRRESQTKDVTLLDVPLRLNVDPPDIFVGGESFRPGKPRKKDLDYANWFTRHYDDIAREWTSGPLEGPDRGKKFHVFNELKRIASITAVAEKLRDSGAPLPIWMRNHRLSLYPTPTSDPRFYNVRDLGNERRAMGGVGMSPIFNPSLKDKPYRLVPNDPEASALGKVVAESLPHSPKPGSITVPKDGKNYTAVVLPGRSSKEVGPLLLKRVDLILPISSEKKLELTRYYSSFLRPNGELGLCWSLDLPHLLLDSKRPVKVEGRKITLSPSYFLTTPMGTVNVSFFEKKYVPQLQGNFHVPAKSDDILAMTGGSEPKSGLGDTKIRFKDGRIWYFGKDGFLCANSEGATTLVYRRDAQNRLTKIEAWYGEKPLSDIRFEYDEKNRVKKADSSIGQHVDYLYDDSGRLTQTHTTDSVESYRYDQSLLVSVKKNGEGRSYQYDVDGRLLKEIAQDGNLVASYKFASNKEGTLLVKEETLPNGSLGVTKIQYDKSFRPLTELRADGTRISFQYAKDGSVVEADTDPNGSECKITKPPDGMATVRLKHPDGGTHTLVEQDGHILLKEGKKLVGNVYKEKDGSIKTIEFGPTAFRWYRDATGIIEELKINQPGDNPSTTDWFVFNLDKSGRVVGTKDSTRADAKILYGPTGKPDSVSTNRGSVNVERETFGRAGKVFTSWGASQLNHYDPQDGSLKWMKISNGKESANASFGEFGVTEVRYFDGGIVKFTYYTGKTPTNGKLQKITTEDGLELKYDYDQRGRLISARYGDQKLINLLYNENGTVASFATSRVP